MTMDVEAGLVDAGGTSVAADIDAIALMINIAAPQEIVVPKPTAARHEPIGQEGEGEDNGGGKNLVGPQRSADLFRILPARRDHHLPGQEVPARVERRAGNSFGRNQFDDRSTVVTPAT